MKPAVALLYLMGVFVFFQLLTGGLRVFGFIDESTHITTGFITFILAVITLIAVAVSKPRFRPAISISALLVLLVTIQGLLGFDYLDTNNSAIIMVHYANALIIYGLGMSGIFVAMRWSKIAPTPPPANQ